ncbi:signal recognition particle protein Srp19 [Thermogladius sp. 4427co]|uniref:signal recognition particle protein Srp19 n=1 Tax=Thermogladius sp. 4427co TaxID=3450718 RepID=UPI003F7A00C5
MSRDFIKEKIVIYPIYIDCSYTRRLGRRLPRNLCVSNPTIEEITEAAKKLGLNPEVEPGKRYPRMWRRMGRVIVDKKAPKTKILRMIAQEIKKMRS